VPKKLPSRPSPVQVQNLSKIDDGMVRAIVIDGSFVKA
jgi:hypothetical protein